MDILEKKNAFKVFLKSRFRILFANIDFLEFSKKKSLQKKIKITGQEFLLRLKMILTLFLMNL